MNSQAHILIVDDHKDIRELVAKYLIKHEFRASTAENGTAMRRMLQTAAVDLVVLDVMMPGEDGLSLCRFLRETTSLPVILLTAMAEETDRVVGLEIGADDYLTKPFNPRELLARIKAVLRRTHSLPPSQEPLPGSQFVFDGWTLDLDQRALIDNAGVLVPLSGGEFALLLALLQRPNMVLSRDQLLDLTKGRNASVFDRSIDNQISRLRRKVEQDPKNPSLIQTVWGGGYKLTGQVRKAGQARKG
ncbi:MAG: response regulator [Pseudomonadota bacterium]